MCKAFDPVLMKVPKCFEVSVVYRQCRRRNNVDEMKEDEIMVYPIICQHLLKIGITTTIS